MFAWHISTECPTLNVPMVENGTKNSGTPHRFFQFQCLPWWCTFYQFSCQTLQWWHCYRLYQTPWCSLVWSESRILLSGILAAAILITYHRRAIQLKTTLSLMKIWRAYAYIYDLIYNRTSIILPVTPSLNSGSCLPLLGLWIRSLPLDSDFSDLLSLSSASFLWKIN